MDEKSSPNFGERFFLTKATLPYKVTPEVLRASRATYQADASANIIRCTDVRYNLLKRKGTARY